MKSSPLKAAQKLEHYAPIPEAGCWLWLGAVHETGYGLGPASANGEMKAHRFFYEAHKGPIPAGMYVLHKCDTRTCVNPDHLFLGTHADNMADMVRKGRHNYFGTVRVGNRCVNGHLVEGENAYIQSNKTRCRTCDRTYARRSRERRKANATARRESALAAVGDGNAR